MKVGSPSTARVVPVALRVELVNATATVHSLSFLRSPPCGEDEIAARRVEIKSAQTSQKIALVKRQIERKGMDWRAGETSLSAKSYQDRKCMFKRTDMLPNIQGLEFYKGGVFELYNIEEDPGEKSP